MLSIPIKTTQELASQRHAGKLLASVFDMLDSFIQPGVSTMAINNRVEDFIVNDLHSRPASKGQYDFPMCSILRSMKSFVTACQRKASC